MSKPITIVLVMSVAITKALCVMMFFMHLKYDNKLFSWVFYAGLILAITGYGIFLATFHFFS